MKLKSSLLTFAALFLCGAITSFGQADGDAASVTSSIGPDGGGSIIVEARGKLPEVPTFFSAAATTTATVYLDRVEQESTLVIKKIQGDTTTLSLGIAGPGEIISVEGDKQVTAWSIRRENGKRFLDLEIAKDAKEIKPVVKIRTPDLKLPGKVQLTQITPGDAVGFSSLVTVNYADGVKGTTVDATGFLPAKSDNQFQTTTGGTLTLDVARSGSVSGAVEFSKTTLTGKISKDGRSATFQLKGTARVSEEDATFSVLSGNAAVSSFPAASEGWGLQLNDAGNYELFFPNPGEFPVSLEFVAAISKTNEWSEMAFTAGSGAVAPLSLSGVPEDSDFRENSSIAPKSDGPNQVGFIPATGNVSLAWKASRKVGDGKLFFSTIGKIDISVGAGLMRQTHQVDYKVLQGELESLTVALDGPGEVLGVSGNNILGWKVTGEGDARTLEVSLSQPITESAQLTIRTQTPLDAFPVRIKGLRATPVGAVRHSGFVRIFNQGSVRLDPAGLAGLTQLSPDQFPGEAVPARQVFVYRFPAATYEFAVSADRIQPEIGVSETLIYQLTESDRRILAAVELDVREAPIREFDLEVPADYSVVSVTGAAVGDYVVATAAEGGKRNLKVIFTEEISGRQLINLNLEKNEVAAPGGWALPQLTFPDAKSVRGDIGIAGAPGFRIAAGESDLLVEKPLSYFPTAVPNLQQAFRIREPGWSATVQIEVLEKSIQADVFHLYSLSEGTVYGSVLVNYLVTGSPVSEWKFNVPEDMENVLVEGKDVRTFRRDGEELTVTLHQPVIGAYTLLVTFEESIATNGGSLNAGRVTPIDVQGERGFVQIVSPIQVKMEATSVSESLLSLNELELPAEFQLLSSAPSLGVWQYTERPFELALAINWFEPGTTVTQVVEFSDVRTRVSRDGELVTDLDYYVKTRGSRALNLKLPNTVRLWSVRVNGRAVTARESDDTTLIPLPGGVDPNVPIQVQVQLGKPAVNGGNPVLALPIVDVPVLKTEWKITGDENHVLVPSGGTVDPARPVLRPSGFHWVARTGLIMLALIIAVTACGSWLTRKSGWIRLVGFVLILAGGIGAIITAVAAYHQSGSPSPLRLSLPVLSAGESVALVVRSVPLWQVDLSGIGIAVIVIGLGLLVWSFRKTNRPFLLRTLGAVAISLGLLIQHDGAPWFFGALAAAILVLLFLFPGIRSLKTVRKDWKKRRALKKEKAIVETKPDGGAATASLLIGGLLALFGASGSALAQQDSAADVISQKWTLDSETNRAKATGTVTLSGKPGDEFILLKTPAVLTDFEGGPLRLTKQQVPGVGLTYVVTIPKKPEVVVAPEVLDPFTPVPPAPAKDVTKTFEATFAFEMEIANFAAGFPLPTGPAAVQKAEFSYNKGGWEFFSGNAIKTEPGPDAADASSATLLLAPRKNPTIGLRPKARDTTTEKTQFYVETSNLYIPGPGVVDGRHRVNIRPSQGLVSALKLQVPDGLTVGEVSGPIAEWQFDAESQQLEITLEPSQSAAFNLMVETQRGLEPLPTDLKLAPVTVAGAAGEVGLVALAFGPDAQPEKVESDTMSAVNLGDFDASLLPNPESVLHQVFRYGADGGEVAVRVAPVAPEVRVLTKQALSLGDERLVLSIQFQVEITRAGLFQLSFPLPNGMEVESLTGAAQHHWSEVSEGDTRIIVMHLNGKTIGVQEFALTLTGATPDVADNWDVPRFILNEAQRQTGELVIRPTTGLRLNTVTRQNISELDPRALGKESRGALAFRLLQKDWSLVVGIEKLDPRITGRVLHEITLREGQTKTVLLADFKAENASVRSLQIALPQIGEDEIKTLRASGKAVSDLVRTAPDSDIWELQFKRRIVGDVQFRIEYDRRSERVDDSETLLPMTFPEARQTQYHYSLRTGGRLEIEVGEMTRGWQRVDWNVVPETLREAGTRVAPVVTLRAVTPEAPMVVRVQRHSLADALKLRVAGGVFTTVLSPTGDELTLVDLTMEVIQRSGLSVGLPEGGELFSIFVNGESVNTIRQGDSWQFHILPGANERTANVRFVYSAPNGKLKKLNLTSPELDVPLENIRWNVLAPKGYELADHEGNLELVREQGLTDFDRDNYLREAQDIRQKQAQQASQLLAQANQLLQAGEQSKALWALNSVANQYALDAASNEDARVQLENLQTQQAVVGLNTRRQRLYLDNSSDDSEFAANDQLKLGAEANPVLQQGALEFRPDQLSQLLQGNTTEDNAVLQAIASRIVRHQQTTDPAPRAIRITLPIEGIVYTFSRPVQVKENAELGLQLSFAKLDRTVWWRGLILIALLGVMAALIFFTIRRANQK